MAPVPSQISGHCLCGGVTYSVDAEPVVQAVCHCTDCQRQTGTAFSVVVGVPRAALTLEGSTLSSFTTTGEDHGTATERHFCSACGSPIVSFARAVPDMAFIKAGTLDDASWLAPAVEVWSRSAQPWVPQIEHSTRLERGPG
jgi:hypothetical protein